MKFNTRSTSEPEINLIPFIDVLLVILIFLMLTTTYSKFNELQLTLPIANAEQMRDKPREIIVLVGADGQYAVNGKVLGAATPETLAGALREEASPESILIISADAMASHQSVVSVMEAARNTGLAKVTFATQTGR